MSYRKLNVNPLVGFLVLAGVIFMSIFLFRALFRLLYFFAPFLLILALVINYKTVINYGKWLIKSLKNSPLTGVIYIVLTVLGFPFVSFYLFGKAILSRQLKKMNTDREIKSQGEFTDFEILDEEPLDLPDYEKKKRF
jgi:hypothetical protein